MKFVSLTFDDGREDNYSIAYPILKRYGFAATIFCTTGFIDGTWEKKEDWYSAESPLKIDQLHDLQNQGWEIALHGDKHVTETNDMAIALKKLKTWGIYKEGVGMSLPDSINKNGAKVVSENYYPRYISYIRAGRKRNTKKLSSKLLYGFYTVFRSQKAYDLFNSPNITRLDNVNLPFVFSLVIRLSDDPKMILRFIENAEDETWIPLMLHSVHSDDNIYKNDPWNWSESKFRSFCDGLYFLKNAGNITVIPMAEVVSSIVRKKEKKE